MLLVLEVEGKTVIAVVKTNGQIVHMWLDVELTARSTLHLTANSSLTACSLVVV